LYENNVTRTLEYKQVIENANTQYMTVLTRLLEQISDRKIKVYSTIDYTPVNNSWIPKRKYYYDDSFFNERSVFAIKSLKNLSKTIFKDCPKILKKIKNKEFKGKSYIKVFDYYNDTCNK